jgi:SEC-C motif
MSLGCGEKALVRLSALPAARGGLGCPLAPFRTVAILHAIPIPLQEVPSCATTPAPISSTAFEPSSKRRKGFPSETNVKRGQRIVHVDKELVEKLGRNDPCPCGSSRRFQELLSSIRSVLTASAAITTFRE